MLATPIAPMPQTTGTPTPPVASPAPVPVFVDEALFRQGVAAYATAKRLKLDPFTEDLLWDAAQAQRIRATAFREALLELLAEAGYTDCSSLLARAKQKSQEEALQERNAQPIAGLLPAAPSLPIPGWISVQPRVFKVLREAGWIIRSGAEFYDPALQQKYARWREQWPAAQGVPIGDRKPDHSHYRLFHPTHGEGTLWPLGQGWQSDNPTAQTAISGIQGTEGTLDMASLVSPIGSPTLATSTTSSSQLEAA